MNQNKVPTEIKDGSELTVSFLPDWDRCPVGEEQAAEDGQRLMDELLLIYLERRGARGDRGRRG